MARRKKSDGLTQLAERRQGQNVASADERAAIEERFLGKLAETCNVADACFAGLISKDTAYRWRKESPEFRARWDEAVSQAMVELEAVAYQRAKDGESDMILKLLLQAHRPDKYRDQVKHQHTGKVTVDVHYITDWRGREARKEAEEATTGEDSGTAE